MATHPEPITAEIFLAIDAGTPRVHRIHGREHVSQPFQYVVEISTHELALDDLRGTLAEVLLSGASGQQRSIHGIVSEAEITLAVGGGQSLIDSFRYRITITPSHATLAFNHGFRVFQQVSTIDICKQIMERAGIASDTVRYALHGTYPKRDMCVQYDESEWDFLCRLFEEEGIWFTFEHAANAHVMLICDDSSNAARIDPDVVELHFAGPIGTDLKATEFGVTHQLTVTQVAIKDMLSLQPSVDLYAEAALETLPVAREWYEFPSRVLDPARTPEVAQRRLDALSWTRDRATVLTNAFHAEAGRLLTLDAAEFRAGDYFITSLDMDLRFVSDGLQRDGGAECDVSLRLIPVANRFCPERVTPRPFVAGLQTARVTGPEGEEIHTDAEGRVKVQFHWDRDGQLDDNTSCWVRVQQAHTTGSFLLPRIGWEVLVEFEEGDPDRPLCLGRVYNPFFPPPFALPAQKTVSAHRSYSTPGGGGVNEISMDDAGGTELLKVFGQFDVHVVAANNRTRAVAQHEAATVGVKRSVHIGADDALSVTANLSESVTADHSIHIGGSRRVTIGGSLTEQTSGNLTRTVGSLEFLHVGNTAKAVIDSILSDAVSACESAAAGLLAPVQSQVAQAQQALSELGAMGAAFGAAVGDHVDVAIETAVDIAVSTVINAVGGGDGDTASAAGPAGSAGEGSWATEVGGAVSETIAGLALFASLKGLSLGVGGDSSETIGAARVEKVGGGKAEVTAASKVETLGSYKVEAKDGIKMDVGGSAVISIKGALEQTIGDGHALVSGAKATLTTKSLDIDAGKSITFQCGLAKVVVNSKGVALSGLQVVLDGKEIVLAPAAIKPG